MVKNFSLDQFQGLCDKGRVVVNNLRVIWFAGIWSMYLEGKEQ